MSRNAGSTVKYLIKKKEKEKEKKGRGRGGGVWKVHE